MQFDFPDTLADINACPEQFRPLYAQPQGSTEYKLQKDNPLVKSSVEAITGLNKTLKTVRGELDALKKSKVDLSPLKDYGEDPTKILETFNTKIKDLQDQLAAKGNNKLDLDNLRKDLTTAFGKEKEALEARIKGLQNQLSNLLIESAAKSALAAANVVDIDLAMPFVKERVKMVEEDGQIKVQVLDDQGGKRYGATGQDMTVAEYVNEMKGNKKFAVLFKSEAPKGGGTNPNGPGNRQSKSTNQGDELTSRDKIALGLAKSPRGAGAGVR